MNQKGKRLNRRQWPEPPAGRDLAEEQTTLGAIVRSRHTQGSDGKEDGKSMQSEGRRRVEMRLGVGNEREEERR